MADLLADEDAIREACRAHVLTVQAYPDTAGFGGRGEPIRLQIDCSCNGLHIQGNVGELMTYVQGHLRAHGVPLSQWWPRRHPDHPLEAARG